MSKRKICVVTGTRAEFGLLEPVMRRIDDSGKLELLPVAIGMHLRKEHGYSFDDVKRKFKNIQKPDRVRPANVPLSGMTSELGHEIVFLADYFNKHRPEVAVVLGDRVEALAGALAAAYSGVCVAHIHGGDVSHGGLDDSARHAITKFAHLHFTATKKAYNRVLKLGERPEYVHLVGAPGLDTILNAEFMPRQKLFDKLKLDPEKPVAVVVQHSVTTPEQVKNSAKQMRATLGAVKRSKIQTVVIYPNNDAGSEDVIAEIEKLRGNRQFRIYKNLPHQEFLGLLKNAAVFIGNSSSGVIESTSFKLPVVNIGTRQQGRERGGNVIDVAHNTNEIYDAIQRALTDRAFLKRVRSARSPYGDGNASERIVKVLSTVKIDERLLQKEMTY